MPRLPFGFTPTPHIEQFNTPMDFQRDSKIEGVHLAKIVNVDPESHAADLVIGSTGRIIRGAPFTSSRAGTKEGSYSWPKVTKKLPGEDADGSTDTYSASRDRDSYVLVMFEGGDPAKPYIMAQTFPQYTHFTNKDIFQIDRSQSDTVQLHMLDGHVADYTNDMSGTVRGWDDERDDATYHDPGEQGPKDFDEIWKVDKTHDFYIASTQMSGQSRVKQWVSGKVSLQRGNDDSVVIHDGGKGISSETKGMWTVEASQPIVLKSETIFLTGDVEITGRLRAAYVESPDGCVPGPPKPGSGSPGGAGTPLKGGVDKNWK